MIPRRPSVGVVHGFDAEARTVDVLVDANTLESVPTLFFGQERELSIGMSVLLLRHEGELVAVAIDWTLLTDELIDPRRYSNALDGFDDESPAPIL